MIIKVCGLTNTRDSLVALDAGADALGFNFWPGSKRFLKDTAFLADLPRTFWRVGLFVEEDPQRVRDLMAEHSLDIAQLHRMPSISGLRIWQAVSVDKALSQADIDATHAEAVVLDTPSGPLAGGTGESFDWNHARGLGGKIVLAGGLDASNVAQAITQLHPWGVDACSRLESEPGKKDPRKVWNFVSAAREAERKAA
jgi:phosphoribosylanthranilate isomerase